ncbi:MAG: hypothetical protein RR569_11775, partial [Acinetobacter sp.]
PAYAGFFMPKIYKIVFQKENNVIYSIFIIFVITFLPLILFLKDRFIKLFRILNIQYLTQILDPDSELALQ